MVEDVEELGLYPELHTLGYRKPLRQIEVIPRKIGTTQGVATEVSELTVLWVIATGAPPSARINCGNKRGGIEPVENARFALHPGPDDARRVGRPERRSRTAVHYPARSLSGVQGALGISGRHAAYGVLRTENGTPLCQNIVPETCQPLSACANWRFRTWMGN